MSSSAVFLEEFQGQALLLTLLTTASSSSPPFVMALTLNAFADDVVFAFFASGATDDRRVFLPLTATSGTSMTAKSDEAREAPSGLFGREKKRDSVY